MKRQRVFETPWFRVVAAEQPEGAPYYMLELQDYVSVVALTTSGRMLLVRQFRPVAGDYTLELPSGHMEPGETPEQAARRELLEETGCVVAGELELMGTLIPDVGRLANRMHCYFARGVRPSPVPAPREAGVTAVEWSVRDVLSGTVDGRIDHALNLAVLMLAVTTGRLTLRDREELK